MHRPLIQRSDYDTRYSSNTRVHIFSYDSNKGERLEAVLNSSISAESFIDRRCNPSSIPDAVFYTICDCQGLSTGWDYFKTDELVYQLCRTCGNPLEWEVIKVLNANYLGDFDLDEFLNL